MVGHKGDNGTGVSGGQDGSTSSLLGGWDASAAQKPRKRSLSIAGHRTSISLEEPFWEALRQAAAARDVSIAAMVAAIDAVRGAASLSSAIRVFVLANAISAEKDDTSTACSKFARSTQQPPNPDRALRRVMP